MITIETFHGLPTKYESFLIHKYQSYLTTCRYFEIYYPTYEFQYMLISENNNLIDLLIFGRHGNTFTCLNSFAQTDQNILSECSNKLWKEHPSIQKIIIATLPEKYRFKKAILYNKTNEYIIHLPSTVDAYYMQLGRSTRKSVRHHKSKLLRDYPGANFSTKFGNEIEESVIDKIIQMNIVRMKYKGIVPSNDENEAKRILSYSKHYGMVTYIEINGIIVAGDIAYILNKRMFTEVIAHDNNFSAYNPGEICMMSMIETAIHIKCETLYLSWGENEYKKRLLAKPHLFYSYAIYRSYSLSYFLNKIKSIISINLTGLRLSKHTKPIREAIKTYRKKKWSLQSTAHKY